MGQGPSLRVRGARVRHEGRDRFTPDGVTLDLSPGEVVLVLGPSGCGKSSVALALNGLIPHAVAAEVEGEILVAGTATTASSVAVLSRTVSMVFQDPDAQVVTGTVLDEVCFGPENLLMPAGEVLARAERALRQVGLWDRRDDNPDVLSGGGRQRLAIACALALDTPVIVLDEPTANLDPAGIDEVYEVLAGVVARGDRSILLVEHNLDAAIDLVDRVVVLDAGGRQVLDGPVRATLVEHADRLVELGVWLPVATIAALRLRDAGVPVVPLPLTPAELAVGLDRLPGLPPPQVAAASREAGAEPAVRVRGLTIARRGRAILRDVSLDIEEGEFVAIAGVNGAGKTTLLQAIAGVVAPPKDRVRVGGLDPAAADVRALARAVGFVFQNPEHQFIRATVAEELAHGLEIQGVPGPEIAERVERMLDRLGLGASRDAHPFLLSGGQKRRLSVGAALIAGAPVLALDEPTFGQDRGRAVELLRMLAGLNADGTTVLMVTHDMQLVADYATRVIVLVDGAVRADGPTSAVLAADTLLEAGLRPPPLARAMRALARHPRWRQVTRLGDLPVPAAPGEARA